MVTPVSVDQFANDIHCQQFIQKKAALAAAGCSKEHFLTATRACSHDDERYYIESTLVAKLAPRGAAIAAVAIGKTNFVREHLHAIVDPEVDDKQYLQLAECIELLPDKQTSLLVLSKCLATRQIDTACTTAPQQFNAQVGTATDRMNVWTTEQTAQVSRSCLIPTAALRQ
eukprot:3665-Heterococcus_DN1.PRE.2